MAPTAQHSTRQHSTAQHSTAQLFMVCRDRSPVPRHWQLCMGASPALHPYHQSAFTWYRGSAPQTKQNNYLLTQEKNHPDPEVWAWASQTRPISKHILLWTSATKVLPKPSTKHTNIQHTFTYFDPNLLIYALISTQYCF